MEAVMWSVVLNTAEKDRELARRGCGMQTEKQSWRAAKEEIISASVTEDDSRDRA